MKIEGSVALVTGGVSGLGFGAASRFVRGGGSVVMLDINDAHGAAAVDALGESARFIRCDVRDRDAVADSVGRAAEEWGRIDILVNAAGVAPAQRLISRDGELFDLDLFKFVIEVNLIGMFDVTRNVAAVMSHQRARSRRGARSDRECGLDRGLRGADRAGCLFRLEGRDRRHDPAPCP